MQAEASLTICEFCQLERISRSMLYKLWRQGKGPSAFNVGKAVRISPEARRAWRAEREAETAHQNVSRELARLQGVSR